MEIQRRESLNGSRADPFVSSTCKRAAKRRVKRECTRVRVKKTRKRKEEMKIEERAVELERWWGREGGGRGI